MPDGEVEDVSELLPFAAITACAVSGRGCTPDRVGHYPAGAPKPDETDFTSTTHAHYPHHLRYATAAETQFVIGSAPAFEREGALLRAFVERFY
jgi:hypothetical protein